MNSKFPTGSKLLLGAIVLALSACAPAEDAGAMLEDANKQVVLDFYDALNDADEAGAMQDRISQIAETYLHPDYTQHAEFFRNLPGPGTDREKLVRLMQAGPPASGEAAPRPATVEVMAEGDRVMLLTRREMPNPEGGEASSVYIFNMFRVENDRLIEHWDASSPNAGPPPSGPEQPPLEQPLPASE